MRWVAAHDRAPAGSFVLTYASRCNYMTRISNGFQLTLERENVFFDYYSDGPDTKAARVPLLSDQEAWTRLPAAQSGGGCPLPSWAKALAASLPHTTAAMLDLDRAYRTGDSLDPRLAGAIRLVVADDPLELWAGVRSVRPSPRGSRPPAIDRLSGDRSELPASSARRLLLPNA